MHNSRVRKNLCITVADEIAKMGIPTLVGCKDLDHRNLLTKWIISFYINTRMIFACKERTKECEELRRKSRQLKKDAKLDYEKHKKATTDA